MCIPLLHNMKQQTSQQSWNFLTSVKDHTLSQIPTQINKFYLSLESFLLTGTNWRNNRSRNKIYLGRCKL